MGGARAVGGETGLVTADTETRWRLLPTEVTNYTGPDGYEDEGETNNMECMTEKVECV